MIKKLVYQLKEKRLEPKEETDISSLLKKIRINIEKYEEIIKEYYRKETGKNADILSVIKSFSVLENNPYGNLDNPFLNDFGRISSSFVPYGVVGLILDKKISLKNFAEILSVFIQTRNSLIIKQKGFFSNTFEFLVFIANEIITQSKDFTKIFIYDEIAQLEQCQLLDLLIHIGDKNQFISEKNNSNVPKKYFGIGNYELYVDEILDQKLINEAKNRNVVLFYSKELLGKIENENQIDNEMQDKNLNVMQNKQEFTEIEKVCNEINEKGSNYCTGIMSGNKSNIRKFLNEIKSSFVLVNMIPTLENRINIYPEDLLKRKSIGIYDK